ncbi:hypothetical protein HYDPIDRAFT_186445, partial [Hydnomerulius pinastri MD-312]
MTLSIHVPIKFPKYIITDKLKKAQKTNDAIVNDVAAPSQDPRSKNKFIKFTKLVLGRKVENTKGVERSVETTSSSLANACLGIQSKQQDKIVRKVKSFKEEIKQVFRTSSEALSAASSGEPPVELYIVTSTEAPWSALQQQDVLTADAFAVSPARVLRDIEMIELVSPFTPSRLRMIAEEAEEAEDTFSIFLGQSFIDDDSDYPADSAAELQLLFDGRGKSSLSGGVDIQDDAEPSPALPVLSSYVRSELGIEGVQLADTPTEPLAMSESEVEFAAFVFNSCDMEEWTDEVEEREQAKYDAYFAYANKALREPVPKLSSFFSEESLAGSVTIDAGGDDITDLSPARTRSSESSGDSDSLADTSLVTTVDAGDSPWQSLEMKLQSLRRTPKYKNLRSSQVLAPSDSTSVGSPTTSYASLDLQDEASSIIPESDARSLRKTAKCRDLRKSFSSLEAKVRSLGGKSEDFPSRSSSSDPLSHHYSHCITRPTSFALSLGSSSSQLTKSSSDSEEVSRTPVLRRGLRLLHTISHPSPRVQVQDHVPCSSHTSSPPSSSEPVWSCAQISRSKRGGSMSKAEMR